MGAYVYDQTRTNIELLPNDVVFDILARVPAHDIHSVARLVSRKWYQTICSRDFLRAQHQQSTCGLLIQQSGSESDKALLFATQKGRTIEKTKFLQKFTGCALSSCNGLVLECHFKNSGFRLRIRNPATNQHLDLPSASRDLEFHNFSIAYVVASNEYKVVCSFCSKSGEPECAIFTVGVDKDWNRRVDIQHLSPTAKKLLGQVHPSSTDGFVHWARYGSSCDSEYVLTLNIETEIITQFPAVHPSLLCGCDGKTNLSYTYLPMGSCLSLLIARADEFPIWNQVWVMKPESGEWTKMMSFDSEAQNRMFEGVSSSLYLSPVGWLKYREVLVFGSCIWSHCIAYNIRTHGIESLELHFSPCKFIVHRNSLVWLDGC